MSERKAAAAIESLLVLDTPSDVLGWDMLGLIEVIGFDYERWCRIVDMNPDDDEAFELFEMVRHNYADVWMMMGEKEFIAAIRPYTDKWGLIVGSRAA